MKKKLYDEKMIISVPACGKSDSAFLELVAGASKVGLVHKSMPPSRVARETLFLFVFHVCHVLQHIHESPSDYGNWYMQSRIKSCEKVVSTNLFQSRTLIIVAALLYLLKKNEECSVKKSLYLLQVFGCKSSDERFRTIHFDSFGSGIVEVIICFAV